MRFYIDNEFDDVPKNTIGRKELEILIIEGGGEVKVKSEWN